MNLLLKLIKQEKSRNEYLINEYQKELKILPKGTISLKKINGNSYYYLNYRDGDKVVSKYIGKDKEKVDAMNDKLARREQIEKIIKKFKGENKKLDKLEEVL